MSAIECSECSVVLLLSLLSLCFYVKELKTQWNQYCNGMKTPRFQALGRVVQSAITLTED